MSWKDTLKKPKRWLKKGAGDRDANRQDQAPQWQGAKTSISPAATDQQLLHSTEATPYQHACPTQADVDVFQPATASGLRPSDTSVETEAHEPTTIEAKTQQAPALSLSQKLWNEAYDSLQDEKETKKLVQSYLETVMKALGVEPDDSASVEDLEDPIKRQKLMEKLVKEGMERVAKASKITKGIGDFAGAILSVKPMVDSVIQNIPQATPAALPWAGVCAGLQILSNPAKATKSNLDGIVYVVSRMAWYCALSEHLLKGSEGFYEVLENTKTTVVTLYKALLRYQMESACSYYRHQGYVFLRSVVQWDDWDDLLQAVKDAEDKIRNDSDLHRKLERNTLLAKLVQLGEDAQSRLGNIDQTLQDFIALQKKRDWDDRDKKCLQDLYLVDPQDDLKRIESNKDALLDGAYKWILDRDEYASFTNWSSSAPSRSLMWVKGHAGTGKTMLLMGIIRQLSSQSATYIPRVSHFFCQGTDKTLNSATAALRSLIWLLLVQQPHLLIHLRSKHENAGSSLFDGDAAFVPLSDALENMVQDPDFYPVYFVVDALDECERGRTALIKLISKTLTLTSKLKWLVSSRPSVELNIPGTEEFLIELDAQKLKDPVDAFIKHKLSTLRDREGYSSRILAKIEDEVRERAQNTFLWVALAFKELDVEDGDSNLLHGMYALRKITALPPSLSKLYCQIIAKIDTGLENDPQYCKAVLATAVLAYRPLTVSELAIVADLPSDMDSKTIIRKCGSFLTTNEDTVYLIHQSAKDFLLRRAFKDIFPSGIGDLHHSIFLRSIKTMTGILKRNMYGLSSPGCSINDIQPPNPDPLAPTRYCCVYWLDHLHDCSGDKCKKELQNGSNLASFLGEKYLYWLEALSLLKSMSYGMLSMTKLESLLQGQTSELGNMVRDRRRFIQYCKAIVESNPLQVYTSGLIFSPSQCQIRRRFQREEPKWLLTKPIMEDDWSSCLQTFEHSDAVYSVAWSPDGRQVASASRDKTVKIWDPATGQCSTTLNGHSDAVWSVAWSPDGRQVASASHDNTVKIWDPATGQCSTTLNGHSDAVRSIAWSPDGRQVASASHDNTVKIWDPATGQCSTTLKSYASSLRFDTSGRLITGSGIFNLFNLSFLDIPSQNPSALLPQSLGYGLDETTTWITYHGQNFIWLPPEYRPSASAVYRTGLVIGCSSGRVLILKFSDKIPAA